MRRNWARGLQAVVLAGLFFLAAGCSGAGTASAPEDLTAPDRQPYGGAPEHANAAPADGAQPSSASDRKITRQASIVVVVEGLDNAVAELHSIASAMGGIITSESLSLPQEPSDLRSGYGTVVVSVPAARLDQALAAIADLGEVRQRDIDSADVTEIVVDTESRIKTMRESIARLQTLMSQAGSISEVAQVETELTQREAELEALLAKLNSLNGQVEMSPVRVELRSPNSVDPAAPNGFVAGVQTGWSSFLAVGLAALTALGVLLPYLAVAAIIIVPIVALRRRRRARAPKPASPTPTASTVGAFAGASGQPAAPVNRPPTVQLGVPPMQPPAQPGPASSGAVEEP